MSDPTRALHCLDSLAAAGGSDKTEAVVVANGMAEPALRVLEARPDIVLVRSGTNLGFAGGNNLAADHARGRYLLFVNDDSSIAPDCIAQLVATAERDRSIGAIGCRILFFDGSLQEAGSVLWSDGRTERVGYGLPAGTRRYSYFRPVDFCSANGLLVRRLAWDAVGGFDERYFPAYYEDVDLCMSLRLHGYRVVYEPRARLRHLESQSTTGRYRRFLLDRNRRQFVAKWSDELAAMDDWPVDINAAAIRHSVHRARGSPPRILVHSPDEAAPNSEFPWNMAEELASNGWAVTVVSAGVGPALGPFRASRADRLVDLGVEVRSDLEKVFRTEGCEWEAIVSVRGAMPPVRRSDGTDIPVVRISPEDAPADVRSALTSILPPVRRSPARSVVRSGRL